MLDIRLGVWDTQDMESNTKPNQGEQIVKLADFITQEGITLSYRTAVRNPHMENSQNMDNWRVTLRRGINRMTLTFSKGYGHNGQPPTATEVLDCLAMDASIIENVRDAEEFANELGYGNRRQGASIYKATLSQTARLRNFLGDNGFNQLVYQTERE